MKTFKQFIDEGKIQPQQKHYHSVFVQGREGKWMHHGDYNNAEDANDERQSAGSRTKVLRVPKSQARWHDVDVHKFVERRSQQNEGILEIGFGTAIGVTAALGAATDVWHAHIQRKKEKAAADAALADHVRGQREKAAAKRKRDKVKLAKPTTKKKRKL